MSKLQSEEITRLKRREVMLRGTIADKEKMISNMQSDIYSLKKERDYWRDIYDRDVPDKRNPNERIDNMLDNQSPIIEAIRNKLDHHDDILMQLDNTMKEIIDIQKKDLEAFQQENDTRHSQFEIRLNDLDRKVKANTVARYNRDKM